MKSARRLFGALAGLVLTGMSLQAYADPLRIGSDWPGWVAWQVAIEKGWFKEAGVDWRMLPVISRSGGRR